jgi:hypothetical protein
LNIAENIATEIKDERGDITKAGIDVLIFSLEVARACSSSTSQLLIILLMRAAESYMKRKRSRK